MALTDAPPFAHDLISSAEVLGYLHLSGNHAHNSPSVGEVHTYETTVSTGEEPHATISFSYEILAVCNGGNDGELGQAIVYRPLHAENKIVIAFRPVRPGDVANGDVDVQSMLDPALIKTSFISDKSVLMSRGVCRHAGSIWYEIALLLKKHDAERPPLSPGEPPLRVDFTGLSLAGALSQICALRTCLDKETCHLAPSVHCVTFGATPCMNQKGVNIYSEALGARACHLVTRLTQNITKGPTWRPLESRPPPWWAPVADADDVTGLDAPSAEALMLAEALDGPVWPQAVGGIQGGIDLRSNKGIKSRYHVLDPLTQPFAPGQCTKLPNTFAIESSDLGDYATMSELDPDECLDLHHRSPPHWKHGAKLTMLQWEEESPRGKERTSFLGGNEEKQIINRRALVALFANQLPLDHTLSRDYMRLHRGRAYKVALISLVKSANNGNFGRVASTSAVPAPIPLTKDNDSFMSERGTTTTTVATGDDEEFNSFRRSRSSHTIPEELEVETTPAVSSPKATLRRNSSKRTLADLANEEELMPPPQRAKSPIIGQLSPGRKSPRSPLCCPGEGRTAARSPRRSPVLRPRSMAASNEAYPVEDLMPMRPDGLSKLKKNGGSFAERLDEIAMF